MVQIIHYITYAAVQSDNNLYIPHGSDNTHNENARLCKILYFISHMVQIIHNHVLANVNKGKIFISHMVQIIHELSECEKAEVLGLLYIPHGSDNT